MTPAMPTTAATYHYVPVFSICVLNSLSVAAMAEHCRKLKPPNTYQPSSYLLYYTHRILHYCYYYNYHTCCIIYLP